MPGFNAIVETPHALNEQPGALIVRMPPRTGPLQEADLRFVEQQVRPGPVRSTVGRRLVGAGAALVVGVHPHWVQGLEHQDTVIAHSLGNDIVDMDLMVETQQGVVLKATYWGRDWWRWTSCPAGWTPASPRLARKDEARDILGDVRSTTTGPFAPP